MVANVACMEHGERDGVGVVFRAVVVVYLKLSFQCRTYNYISHGSASTTPSGPPSRQFPVFRSTLHNSPPCLHVAVNRQANSTSFLKKILSETTVYEISIWFLLKSDID